MPIAQAARELLLLQVHDAHDVRQLVRVFRQKAALHRNTHLREHDPPRALELRHRHGFAESVGEHVPQALLESLCINGFQHLVLADDKDRKSTRLNSSHQIISYAVFCLKKKKSKGTEPVSFML